MADEQQGIDQKRYAEFEAFRKSRERADSDFIENLNEQLSITKQLGNSYKNILGKLERANDLQDKARAMQARINSEIQNTESQISALDQIILRNNSELNDTKREMVSNANRLLQIDAAAEILSKKRIETEQELKYSMDRREGLQWAITEKVKEETEQRSRSADLTARITENNKEQQKIQEKINKGFVIREEGEREISRLQQQNVAFAGELLISQDAMNQASAEKLSLQERLNTEIEVYESAYERSLGIENSLVELQKEKTQLQERNIFLQAKEQNLNERNERAELKRNGLIGQRGNLQKSLTEWASREAKATEMINKLSAQLVLVKMIQLAYERFKQLDAAAENFRRETGFSIDQMKQLRKDAEALNVQFADMGVSIEKVYASAKALTDVFGRTSLVTKEALQNVSLLSANLGVAEADSANVLAIFQGLGNATEQAAMNVIKVGAGISEKAGVPFSLVMKDIANASEQTTALIGANPSKLMKSAIAARALGTDLNKIVSSQRKLLDFSSSITDELEASAMLGKNISFQKARQLAYEGDIEGAAKATLETVKAAGNFDKMSVYQREALAKASGMELKDLTKMMAVDKQREAIMNGTDEAKKKQLLAQEAELANLKKIDDLNNADLVKQNERALMQQKMQGVMTRLKNLMESLTVAFADILEPVVTPLMEILVPVFKLLAVILKYTIIPVLKFIAFPIQEAVKAVQKLFDGFQKGKTEVTKTGQEVSSFFKFFEDGWGYALKIIGGLAAGGLLGMMMFGKSGLGSLLDMIKTPFNTVKDLSKNIIQKITGRGIVSTSSPDFIGPKLPTEAARGAADATKGTVDAAKSTKSIPAGSGIKDFLTNLAAGLKEMGSGKVLFGAANLLIAAVPLAVIAPVALLASVLGLVGKPIETGLSFLAKGIGHMGNTNVFKGALGIALVGASIIPFAFAMKMFSEVNWASVGIGALALVGFTAAAFGLGALLSTGVGGVIFGAGVIGIAALGAALIPFGVAALAAGAGIKMLGEGISSSVDPILTLSTIDLTTTAIGITAVGAALAAFGGGSAAAGLGSFVGKFLSGDPIEKMEKLAAIGDKLKVTADSITAISLAAAQFSTINVFSDAITKLSESLTTLSNSINKFDSGGIAKLSQISAASGTAGSTRATTAEPTTNGVESKLDELISLMKQGRIIATVDIDKLSNRTAKASGN